MVGVSKDSDFEPDYFVAKGNAQSAQIAAGSLAFAVPCGKLSASHPEIDLNQRMVAETERHGNPDWTAPYSPGIA
jgi:hypothetical protein